MTFYELHAEYDRWCEWKQHSFANRNAIFWLFSVRWWAGGTLTDITMCKRHQGSTGKQNAAVIELVVDSSTKNSPSNINKIYVFTDPKDCQVKHYYPKKKLWLLELTWPKTNWWLKEISIFLLSTNTRNLYLTKIIFVTDVAVLTIQTIKLVFKLIFLKEFHFLLKTLGYLCNAFEIREKGMSAKKVTLRDAKEDVDKVCIEVQKTWNNAGGKPTRVFSHFNTKHLGLLTTPKTLEPQWRNRLKELRIRSGLHSRAVELSRVKYFESTTCYTRSTKPLYNKNVAMAFPS